MGTFLSDIVLQVLSFVAENERSNIRSRQKEGIEAARQRGVQFGRPPLPVPEDFEEICRKWKCREITSYEAAKLCGFSRTTFYKRVRNMRMSEEEKEDTGNEAQ